MSRRPYRLTPTEKSSNSIDISFSGQQVSAMLHGIDPVFAGSGLAVGLLVGITGVGGGSLMTPLLVLVFGVHPATAVGTDLLYAGLTKITGGAVHAYHRSVDWRITRRLAYGSVPAALLSLLLLARLGSSSRASGGIISTTLGIALLLTAVTLIFRKALLARLARVMNGASELLQEVFGEAGRHARSAVGMAVLPLDAPVEVELIAEVG